MFLFQTRSFDEVIDASAALHAWALILFGNTHPGATSHVSPVDPILIPVDSLLIYYFTSTSSPLCFCINCSARIFVIITLATHPIHFLLSVFCSCWSFFRGPGPLLVFTLMP